MVALFGSSSVTRRDIAFRKKVGVGQSFRLGKGIIVRRESISITSYSIV